MTTDKNIVQGYKIVRAGEFVGKTVLGSACALHEDLRAFALGLKPMFDWAVQYEAGVTKMFGVDRPGFAFASLGGAKLGVQTLGGYGIDLRIYSAELVVIDNYKEHPHMWQPSDELRPFTLLCASIKILEEVA